MLFNKITIMNYQEIVELIAKRGSIDDMSDSDSDFFFYIEENSEKFNYHMHIDLDAFLNFWNDLTKKDSKYGPIKCEDFFDISKNRFIYIRAIESISNPNITGYLEFYRVC